MNTVNTISPEAFQSIHDEAIGAAIVATQQYVTDVLGGRDQFPCGFAWVNVDNVNRTTKLGKALEIRGFDPKFGQRGLRLWNPSKYSGQNVYAKYEGAKAYAEVLCKYGINAYAQEQWD